MDSPARRRILFHAIGSMAILLWIALTQAIAEPSHKQFGHPMFPTENVSLGRGVSNLIGLGITYFSGLVAYHYWITSCLARNWKQSPPFSKIPRRGPRGLAD